MHPSLSLLFSLTSSQDEHKRNTSCYTEHHLVLAHWKYSDNKTVGQPGQATAAVATKGSSRGKGAEGKMDLTASRDLAPWRNRLIAWRGRELEKCDINTHLPHVSESDMLWFWTSFKGNMNSDSRSSLISKNQNYRIWLVALNKW